MTGIDVGKQGCLNRSAFWYDVELPAAIPYPPLPQQVLHMWPVPRLPGF
jgi:hypothetical protein